MTPQRTKRVIVAGTVAVIGIVLLLSWFGGDPFDWSKQSTKTRWEMLGGFSVAAVVAFVCHWFIRRWLIACIVCSVVLTGFVIVLSLASGPPDPLWLIGLFTVLLTSFVLAAVVGVIFVIFRRGVNIT
jgi:hypothetical protein